MRCPEDIWLYENESLFSLCEVVFSTQLWSYVCILAMSVEKTMLFGLLSHLIMMTSLVSVVFVRILFVMALSSNLK